MGYAIKSRIADLQNIATHLKSQLNSNVDFNDFLFKSSWNSCLHGM